MTKKRNGPSKLIIICVIGFALAAVLVAADKILDIPVRLFNAPPTPTNWTEIAIEVASLAIIGAVVIFALVKFSSERRQAEEARRKVNRALRTISDCNKVLVRVTEDPDLIHRICQTLVKTGGYRLAWVGLSDPSKNELMVAGQAWGDEGHPGAIDTLLAGAEHDGSPPAVARQTGKVCLVKDILAVPGRGSWQAEAARCGYRSLVALPLAANDQTLGVLSLYDAEADAFNPDEVRLLTELADDLTYGIRVLRTRTEHEQAEAALRASKERYRTTLDGMLEGCQIIGFDWRYTYVNNAAVKQSRRSRDELIGHTMMELYPGIEDTEMFTSLRLSMEKRIPICMENLFTYPGGSQSWFELSIEPVPEGIFILTLDITERQRANEALRLERSKLKGILDRMNDGVCIINQTGDVEYTNPVIESWFGAVKGRKCYHYFHDRTDVCPWCRNAEVFQGKSLQREWTSTGNGKTYDLFDTPLVNSDGSVSKLEIFHNITGHKQAEEALVASEEKLRLMFKSVSEGIVCSGLNDEITDVNEIALHIFGYDRQDEVLGHSVLEYIAERDHPRVRDNVRKTLALGRTRNIEYTFLRKANGEFPGELSASVLNDTAGKPIGFVSIISDITERKRMQEQLILTDRLASVGELASGIAHELNNPLTAVIGFSELLLGREVPVSIREDLVTIHSEALRAATVVRNLLTFARKHPLGKQPVDINNTIQKVLDIRAYEQRVNNILVDTSFAADLPSIMADDFQLQQVFLNIIINAEYFMTEAHGGGTLTITTGMAGDMVRISLADNGPGVNPENLGHIFDPFFTTKEVGKGTGLGLSICHGIISGHGGRIYAESEPGKGATFIVELPSASAGKGQND